MLLNNDTAPETALVPMAAGDILCQVLPSGSGFENENNLKPSEQVYDTIAQGR